MVKLKDWFMSWLPTKVEFRESGLGFTGDTVPSVQVFDCFTGPETSDGQLREELQQKSADNDCKAPYYAKALNLHASMVVGSGPMVVITDDRITPEDRKHLKKRWRRWTQRSGFVRTLRSFRRAGMKVGEGLAYFVTAERQMDPVKLKLVDVSATRLQTPLDLVNEASINDGIQYSEDGQPTKFFISGGPNSIDEHDASRVAYWFCGVLEEQKRGIPELHTTLDWFPKITAFQNAVISSMELFARMPLALEVDAAWIGDDDDSRSGCPLPTDKPFKMPANGLMVPTLPKGTSISKMQGEAPGTDSKDALKSIVTMAVSPIFMPAILIMGDAGDASFSAANIDWEPYLNKIYEDRAELEPTCSLSFEQWLLEGAKIPGYFGPSVVAAVREDLARSRDLAKSEDEDKGDLDIDHEWRWGRVKCHIDPNKEASARQKDLESCAMTLPEVYESRNEDLDERVEQASEFYNVSPDEYRAMLWSKLKVQPTTPSKGSNNAKQASSKSST